MAKPKSPTAKQKAEEAPRGGRPRATAELLGEIGGMAFRRFGFVQSAVVSRWAEIVGERYAKVSSPESIRFPTGARSGGVLTLMVEGAHSPLLQHLSPLIIERVNRFFGYQAINRVVFRQGRPSARRAETVRPKPQPVPKELGEGLRQIADPELRACLESLAGRIAGSAGAPTLDSAADQPIPVTFRSE
jgi:hypothetical protein